jgi:hypothetical protein
MKIFSWGEMTRVWDLWSGGAGHDENGRDLLVVGVATIVTPVGGSP